MIKLYDFILNRLIAALTAKAEANRKAAAVLREVAIKSLDEADELATDASKLDDRASLLKAAL